MNINLISVFTKMSQSRGGLQTAMQPCVSSLRWGMKTMMQKYQLWRKGRFSV